MNTKFNTSILLRPLALAALVLALAASGAADKTAATETPADGVAVAVFAGGCFWCMEPPFDRLRGVLSTTSGYIDGNKADPTYQEVSSGATGHTEAVEVRYDPEVVTYADLLEVFWRNIDPFAVDRQFCDVGSQYRSGVYYRDDEERALAEAGVRAIGKRFGRPVATQIKPASTFYAAEDYHQDYYEKNPIRYKFYRYRCGRDQRLEEIWD